MRSIKVPTGIGDNVWLLQKLINTGEQFNFQMGNGNPQRGKQIFDLLPQVSASCEYVDGLQYPTLDKFNVHRERKYWKDIDHQDMLLSMNRHLEHGHRIESFFPDLETTWIMPWQTDEVCDDLPKHKQYIGIYASAYSTARAWNFWGSKEWFFLIQELAKVYREACFVIIGASWDNNIAAELMQYLKEAGIQFYDTIGTNLGYFIKLCEHLNYFVAFPSGLPILNETIQQCGTFMFYPPRLEPMMFTWASPERIGSKLYQPRLFMPWNEAVNIVLSAMESAKVEPT